MFRNPTAKQNSIEQIDSLFAALKEKCGDAEHYINKLNNLYGYISKAIAVSLEDVIYPELECIKLEQSIKKVKHKNERLSAALSSAQDYSNQLSAILNEELLQPAVSASHKLAMLDYLESHEILKNTLHQLKKSSFAFEFNASQSFQVRDRLTSLKKRVVAAPFFQSNPILKEKLIIKTSQSFRSIKNIDNAHEVKPFTETSPKYARSTRVYPFSEKPFGDDAKALSDHETPGPRRK